MPRVAIHIILTIVIATLGFFAYRTMSNADFIKKIGLNNENLKEKADLRKRKNLPKRKLLTRAIPLEKTSHTITLTTQGFIRAHHTTSLTAQVNGRILRLSPQFEAGSFFKHNDVLLEIDPADFRTELASAKAQLARAESAYAQEQARAKQALLNWQDAGFTEQPSDLVLRKPQLREAKANVTSAQAGLERAERNLARTKVRAPYDGRVRTRDIGPGQQVGATTPLGEIYSTDLVEIRLPLTLRDLSQYTPPNANAGDQPHAVKFTTRIESTTHTTWQGEIVRTEGVLDEASRQLIVIAHIKDPFSLNNPTNPKSPLFIGQPITAHIPAKILKDVHVIPREHLSGLNEILVVRDETLKRIKVTPLWSDQQNVILSPDIFKTGDLLAISNLPYAPDNSPVIVIPSDTSEPEKPAN